MLKVLFLTYNFPPEGGPAVQRVVKFIKYLSRAGISCSVLTASKKNRIVDTSFNKDIPNSVKITKTVDPGSWVPGEFKRIFKRIFIPDKMALWQTTAMKKGAKLIKRDAIQCIFSTSPPHSTHLIAKKIADSTGSCWVADFRDEWIRNSLFFRSTYASLQKQMEMSVLERCDRIITVTKTAKQNFAKSVSNDKINYIPNGYDEEDLLSKLS